FYHTRAPDSTGSLNVSQKGARFEILIPALTLTVSKADIRNQSRGTHTKTQSTQRIFFENKREHALFSVFFVAPCESIK
ncbi:MAG: hypothetical protein R6X27_06620, partial [Candidatus Desulfacyla sp.]